MIMEFYEVLEAAAGFWKSALSWLNSSPKQLEVSTASEFPVRKEEVPQNTVRVTEVMSTKAGGSSRNWVVLRSFDQNQTPDLGMSPWRGRNVREELKRWLWIAGNQSALRQSRCLALLSFFSTVTGLSGLWTCAAAQNELCFRLRGQLCQNWGSSRLDRVCFFFCMSQKSNWQAAVDSHTSMWKQIWWCRSTPQEPEALGNMVHKPWKAFAGR